MNKTHATKPAMLTVEQALSHLLAQAVPLEGVQRTETARCLGRILAEPQISTVAVPPLDNSAMDGYAVACADLRVEGETRLRVSQRIPAGCLGQPLEPGTAARIFTGAPVPAGADAVVMQEHCAQDGEWVTIRKAVKPGENIRRAGEDIAVGATVLAAGAKIRPQEMGLAASVGLASLPIFRRLKVAVFFTGDEIVMPGEPLRPGQIYNSNRFTLAGLLESLGCEIVDYGIVPDNLEATAGALNRAADGADLILTSGGVSVGEEDHVKAAVEQNGKLDMWRVAMKPGKPLAFGAVGATPFIGLPGNPVSAFVTFCLFVRPYILRRQGAVDVAPRSYALHAEFDWSKPGNRREYVRARLEPGESGAAGVVLYPNQGSGVLTSAAWADGLVEIPESRTVRRGETVKFIPFSSLFC